MMTDKELKDLVASLAISQAETNEQLKETDRLQKQNQAAFERLNAEQAKSDKRLSAERAKSDKRLEKQLETSWEKFEKQLKISQAKSDKETAKIKKIQQEAAKEGKEIGRRIDSVGKQLGSMGITQGDFAEEFFYRSLEEKPQLGNIVFDDVERQITISGNKGECDIILRNGDSIGIIEVKYKAHPDEMHSIIKNKVKTFRTHFKEYKNHKLYFGIASMVTNPKVIETAKKEGIFLLTQQGKHLEIVAENIKTF